MKNFCYLILLVAIIGCQNEEGFKIDNEYEQDYQEFKKRIHEEHIYYLSISDMFELDSASPNTFGSSPENKFQLKDSTAPARLGSIIFENDSLIFHSSPNVEVKLENDSVIDTYNLISLDYRGHSINMYHENYSWYVNSLENVKLLRIMDSRNPEISKFPGFQTYDLNPEFIFEAKLTYYDSPKVIEVPVTQGNTREAEFIGSIEFEYKGQTHSLDFMEGNFIMFGDKTALTETYGAGRYLEFTTNDNKTAVLDFNHAYNPPCSYSGFTTCSYPPEENWLELEVKAGEKEALLNKS
ncbi:DUF1684 domain-containing protein [Christiangramia crocea]|uniref:DUF1684 domain-containing protein n=1 Tax=Christiangramia crocea TaxID=2904124 RepID=A0A9X1UV29_9FLAO|nr:DUF1684 domain-containing protein [Gramella crocea]MCG9970646.1 DUF1684 domain-containing protein [Gramella crocea]